ncbi:MAG: purine-nucleoside phosphorylase [Actinomycetota bacterium]
MAGASDSVPGPGDDLPADIVRTIRLVSDHTPRVAVVAGSGLSSALEGMQERARFAYADLPGLPDPTVPGHAGHLVLGEIAGVPAVAFLGRFHLYEGHPVSVPALLPRVAYALGARTLVVTAAVGAIADDLAPGTVVVIRDHLNFLGENPLRGWRMSDGSPAFVELSRVYDARIAALAQAAGAALGTRATYGVYAALPGPTYETPAETAFLRTAGADVVGMSVVPETVPAHALGMQVLGLACVTNTVGAAVDHADVVRVSRETGREIGTILAQVLPQLEP